MRKNFGPKPYLYPQPVLIIATYGDDGTPDAMNAAWGGISDGYRVALYLCAGHKTGENYVGIVSANQVPDKLARAGLHTTRSQFVDAPLIDELPMALECRFLSFDEETELLLGEIINVSAEEYILGEDGKIDPAKLRPISFDPVNHDYLALGEKVGRAFQDGKRLK